MIPVRKNVMQGKFIAVAYILIIHIIVSYDQNISLIVYLKMYPMCLHITAQWQYTAVQKMRTPLK